MLMAFVVRCFQALRRAKEASERKRRLRTRRSEGRRFDEVRSILVDAVFVGERWLFGVWGLGKCLFSSEVFYGVACGRSHRLGTDGEDGDEERQDAAGDEEACA